MPQEVPTGLSVKELKLQADKTSWKDEMWAVAMGGPIILAFIPWLQDYAAKGFTIIATAPLWYVTLVAVSVAYAYHRKVFSLFGMMRGATTSPPTTKEPTSK